MKKVLALGMAAAMLASSASAANRFFSFEEIKSKIPDQVVPSADYSKMTDEELTNMIEAAQAELASRADNTVNSDLVHKISGEVFNHDGYRLVVNDVSAHRYNEFFIIELDVIAENTSDKNVEIDFSIMCVGDWTLSFMASQGIDVKSGKKASETLSLYCKIPEYETIDDVDEIVFSISVWDSDRSLFNLYKTGELTGTFK